jgi:aspartate racemase
MTAHIGIVACSAEGASLCYRTICVEGPEMMGIYAHPEVTVHTFSLGDYMNCIDNNDWDGVARLMLASVNKLAKVGAQFSICPDNTCHNAFELVVNKSPIPWLHIAEEVAVEARWKNYKCLLILGTKPLMESTVYPVKLNLQGIKYMIPDFRERERINEIILDELVCGRFLQQSRMYIKNIIDRLKGEGCDAVVLACTELPLLISPEDSPLPTLDSTRLLAKAALRKSINSI